jgi:transcriptional regulator with XRE-family HTH domain
MTTLVVLRKHKLMTQGELATAAGVIRATVSYAETGLTHPKIVTIRKICTVLGVRPEDVDEFRTALELPSAPGVVADDTISCIERGHRFRQWREALALTQLELAHQSGVSTVTISGIEQGLVQPQSSTVRKLAKIFGVQPVDLLKRQPPSNVRRCAGCNQVLEYSQWRGYHSNACRQRAYRRRHAHGQQATRAG